MRVSGEDPLWILSPVARGRKGEFASLFDKFSSLGYDRARVDGKWVELWSRGRLNKRKDHFIDLLLDKVSAKRKNEQRIRDAVGKALEFSNGYVKVENRQGLEKNYSLHFACPRCDYSFFDLEPGIFSFNSPKGACDSCGGTGLSFSEEQNEEGEEAVYVSLEGCSVCGGSRLKKDILSVKVGGKNIAEVNALSGEDLAEFAHSLRFKGSQKQIADKILPPVLFHTNFLKELGLDYLSLDRSVSSLSGGEAQRLRLVSQMSSPLIGVLYVLDEPSIGLHYRDHGRILRVLEKIRNRGNTIIMVEHDEESINHADQVIDLGPGAGIGGGYITAHGTLDQIKKNPRSLTGAYLSRKEMIPLLESSWTGQEPVLQVTGAKKNNLQSIDVKIPLGRLTGVSGVSGSGKSTLILDTIYPVLLNYLTKTNVVEESRLCHSVSGLNHIDRVIPINQKPIGRTPRSVPVTYVQVFQHIRALFAYLPASRVRGFSPGYFSFNIQGGRCENCKGRGSIKLEMRFLPDVWTLCDMCQGNRYSPDILNVKYKDKNISDVLKMTVDEAEAFFKNHRLIHSRLKFLKDVGLGYIALGQNSATLSGGEAQRIKLSRELSKNTRGHTFYILDEPTTGLHFDDIKRLVELMRQLSDKGHTVVVIEHNLEVLKSCDYLLDLGPEGGKRGGRIVAAGPPAVVAKNPKSLTGRFLKRVLKKPRRKKTSARKGAGEE